MNKKDKIGIVAGVISVVLAGVIVAVDYKNSKWNCYNCGATFKAPFGEYFFAGHTPTRRRLTCPNCGKKSYCKVQYRDKE